MKFICPASMRPHVQKVFAGEYDLPVEDVERVLDIGANVGAFAMWAPNRWPWCIIDCYEPDPANYATLQRNCEDEREGGTRLHPVAVCFAGKAPLYRGRNNCGESTLFPNDEHDVGNVVEVECISAQDLPPCDVLKIDTEGAEFPIVAGYAHMAGVKGVAYEWHSQRDREAIARILVANGLHLYKDTQWAAERGVARWVR